MCINAAFHSLLSLLFQEQIKGPENAPIARFDGLGCYQTHSETDGGFRSGKQAPDRKKRAARATPESALAAAWLQRLKRFQCPAACFGGLLHDGIRQKQWQKRDERPAILKNIFSDFPFARIFMKPNECEQGAA